MNTQTELEKTYSPQEVQNKWYPIWEHGKYFKAKEKKGSQPFTILMPPPNVTGQLHEGHALDVTTQDALIRFKRMKGYETLWIPGMDHAGIATQAVVEKKVWKEEKKTRHDFSREDFLDKIWKWKEEYGGIIAKQQRALGASADWDYFLFTMDDHANKAVKTFFIDMYMKGLIYKSRYIINWDPILHSAISDAEVEYKEVKGAFYHIKYLIEGSNDFLEVATTRPETMFGDTAVAINPNDERYKHLLGRNVIIPICNRVVKIIADEHVDLEKGTGCLKVTPGHDFHDFEIGKRHNLEIIEILNKDGTLNKEGMEFQGLSCLEARKKIIEKLKELNLLLDIKEHIHQVGHGERSGAIIEPMMSNQWFLNVQKMAKDAVKQVEEDVTRFYPKSWENTFFSWLKEPRDWCISRQLWWGHRIPVFYCSKCNHTWAEMEVPSVCEKCSSKDIFQDPDVLDTWFSSGLWPLSTLGWPDQKKMKELKFEKFFPNSVLVTGFDIIFFWVARMMMMSLEATNKVPFDKVYIHAIVRDKEGRKISKSIGNGIDPVKTIETYGADALRFTLAAGSGYNRTLNLDPERINGYRNFINKVWNAFRFIHPFINKAQTKLPNINELSLEEKWILSELNQTTDIMNKALEEFRFDEACAQIYSFVYDKFCSWFIELSKDTLYGENIANKEKRATVLKYAFKKIVALMHPITPFITEEIWGLLKEESQDLLIVSEYPEFDKHLEFLPEQDKMNKLIDVITAIRNLRASVNVKPKEEITTHLFIDDEEIRDYFLASKAAFLSLAKVKDLHVLKKSSSRPVKSIMAATTHTEIFIPLDGVIDLNEYVKRIENDLEKSNKEFLKFDNKINNAGFINSAPKEVVEEVKVKREELFTKISAIKDNLKRFK